MQRPQWPAGDRDQPGVGGVHPAGLLADGRLADRRPEDEGMDPAVLDELDAKVPESYPQVRSLLVVRHGYLVYERYWHGLDASDGHNSHSVTKSVTSALVGIALADHKLRSLDQTVGELLAAHLPPRPIRGCAGLPWSSC